MKRSARALVLAVLVSPAVLARPAEAQMVVTGGLSVAPSFPRPVAHEKKAARDCRPRRERNPYFAARPNYAPPANNGARANITFEPYTSKYYPNENSYYPPLDHYPSIRSR